MSLYVQMCSCMMIYANLDFSDIPFRRNRADCLAAFIAHIQPLVRIEGSLHTIVAKIEVQKSVQRKRLLTRLHLSL